MKKILRLLAACLSITCICFSSVQGQNIPPKREFRGAWVATVANIDFPSRPGLSNEDLKREWSGIVRDLDSAGFNAVLVQVRPAGDAFYKSRIAPWSKYLSGRQGLAPEDNFDPMDFMVAEAHAHHLEFHAWLNPYRASMDTVTENLAQPHPYREHPDWFTHYGGKLYFNPALPEVRSYITEVVTEIVMNYEVDGIHFDDYFYPYPAGAEKFDDTKAFQDYGYGSGTLENWRRENVDKLISQVSAMLKAVAPQVKFGVSPFGVWRNREKDPELGSATRAGINCYDDLYADVRLWLEKGWIDYVAPQLYWHIGFAVADYEILLDWWRNNAFGRMVFAGQAAYKVGNNPEEPWQKKGELTKQVRLNRKTAGIGGSVFYNTTSVRKNTLSTYDSLGIYFSEPALMPEMAYMSLPDPATPELCKPRMKNGALTFSVNLKNKDSNANQLIVYRFEDRRPGDYNNPQNILQLHRLDRHSKTILIEDKSVEQGKIYTYNVSTLSPQYTESNLSSWRAVQVKGKKAKKVK